MICYLDKQPEVSKELIGCLNSASALLSPEQNVELLLDTKAICDYLVHPNFRIAVFAPFNHGKSTLLNALLGSHALPMDLIPTTGSVINIKYGDEVRTRITMLDGSHTNESGTEILKRFAILDDERRMRDDVAYVEVFCPDPLLKEGVELLDLPGTNDMAAQDDLVRSQILSADLVIQVLDARKLMTLGEREGLRDWLIDRGINTVIFVINFLNLLEPSQQQEVCNRAGFIAQSFRADLPDSISNLYRVDALPALRALLKKDVDVVRSSGILDFKSALEKIVAIQSKDIYSIRLPRVMTIASQVNQVLQAETEVIASNLKVLERDSNAEICKRQQLEENIKKSFQASIAVLKNWLSMESLLERYQSEAASALKQGEFSTWETNSFKPALVQYKLSVVKWVNKGCDIFDQPKLSNLFISFPTEPSVSLPDLPVTSSQPTARSVGIATGVGLFFLGPLGAAVAAGVTHIVNENTKQEKQKSLDEYHSKVSQAYTDAARDYLSQFSMQTLETLCKYEVNVEKIISFPISQELAEVTDKRNQLKLLHTSLGELTIVLNSMTD